MLRDFVTTQIAYHHGNGVNLLLELKPFELKLMREKKQEKKTNSKLNPNKRTL